MSELLPHQQRVVDEKDALAEKIGKLESFLGTSTFSGLDSVNQLLLKQQIMHMQCYADTLERRIELFSPKTTVQAEDIDPPLPPPPTQKPK